MDKARPTPWSSVVIGLGNYLSALTASDVGAFGFCPRAWYLQRMRVAPTADAERRRRQGSRLHRTIGRRTDVIRVVAVIRTILLIAILVGLFFLAAALPGGL